MPARAEALAREADEATKAAAAAKPPRAAKREAAAATAAARNLEFAQETRRCRARLRRKGSLRQRPRSDQPRPWPQDIKQKAAAKIAALRAHSTPPRPTPRRSRMPPRPRRRRQDGRGQAEPQPSRPRPTRSSPASRSRSSSAARRRSFTCGATPTSGFRTAARCTTRARNFRSRSRIPTSRSARTSSLPWRAMGARAACAGPKSHRQRRHRQGRARPHHLPAGGARPDRAHRVAAVLDHHLGPAAEQRNQLSHRVRGGAEQPAAGRLRQPRALAGDDRTRR